MSFTDNLFTDADPRLQRYLRWLVMCAMRDHLAEAADDFASRNQARIGAAHHMAGRIRIAVDHIRNTTFLANPSLMFDFDALCKDIADLGAAITYLAPGITAARTPPATLLTSAIDSAQAAIPAIMADLRAANIDLVDIPAIDRLKIPGADSQMIALQSHVCIPLGLHRRYANDGIGYGPYTFIFGEPIDELILLQSNNLYLQLYSPSHPHLSHYYDNFFGGCWHDAHEFAYNLLRNKSPAAAVRHLEAVIARSTNQYTNADSLVSAALCAIIANTRIPVTMSSSVFSTSPQEPAHASTAPVPSPAPDPCRPG